METLKFPKTLSYPSPQTMDLFLTIGQKLDCFNTLVMKIKGGEQLEYRNTNAVHLLSVVCEYLAQPEHQSEKQYFLQDLENKDKYKIFANLALKIWWSKNPNYFTQGMIKNWENDVKNKENISINDLPMVPNAIDPDWYINDNTGLLLHELFQEKLAESTSLSTQADQIQEKTTTHTQQLETAQSHDTNTSAQIEEELKSKL